MAPKRRPSVLEGSSQLSFIGSDNELHRDFQSRPISIQRNKRNKLGKKRICNKKPAIMQRSPLEQLSLSSKTSRSPKRRSSFLSTSSSSSSENGISGPIPRKAKTHAAGNKMKSSSAPAATMLLQRHQREAELTKEKDRIDEITIPRKPKVRATSKQQQKTNDEEDGEMEIPYTQDFGTTIAGSTKAVLGGKSATEPLRAGDVIFYYNPIFVAGRKEAIVVTQILAVDPSVMKKNDTDVFPLDLGNAALIPTDTYITRIKEYRDGKLFPHCGIQRRIQDFRLISGKLAGKTGMERRMEAFKTIIAQAQQQLEDDFEKGHQETESEPSRSSSDDDGSCCNDALDNSLVPSTVIDGTRQELLANVDLLSPSKPTDSARSLLLRRAKEVLRSSLKDINPVRTETSSAAAEKKPHNKAATAVVGPKGLFDDQSSSDEETFEPVSSPKLSSPATNKSTVSTVNPSKRASILEDSSDADDDSEVLSKQRRILTVKQLHQSSTGFKGRKMKLSRSSQGANGAKRSSSKSKVVESLDKEPFRKTKQVSQIDEKASPTEGQQRQSKDLQMHCLEDSTDDEYDHMLKSNISRSRRCDSDSLSSKRKTNDNGGTMRVKSFLHVSPKERKDRSCEQLSMSLACQKEEFDRLLHGASQSTSTKPVKVKRSITSSYHPLSVEDASSCNEFANHSSSDEDNETFFSKRKELRRNQQGQASQSCSKFKHHDDHGSITTTFSSSQSDMGKSNKKKMRESAGKSRLSSSNWRQAYRPSRMELKLEPIPQDDSF